MKPSDDVAVFWDYGYSIVNNIRTIAQSFGSIKTFKAYLELNVLNNSEQGVVDRNLVLRSELQCSGVTLVDCPKNGQKDVADKMILVDMFAHAIDKPAPSTIVLISGDKDFAYALSVLRMRRYKVILIALSSAHTSLVSQASLCFDWTTHVLGAVSSEDPGAKHFDPLSPARGKKRVEVDSHKDRLPYGFEDCDLDELVREKTKSSGPRPLGSFMFLATADPAPDGHSTYRGTTSPRSHSVSESHASSCPSSVSTGAAIDSFASLGAPVVSSMGTSLVSKDSPTNSATPTLPSTFNSLNPAAPTFHSLPHTSISDGAAAVQGSRSCSQETSSSCSHQSSPTTTTFGQCRSSSPSPSLKTSPPITSASSQSHSSPTPQLARSFAPTSSLSATTSTEAVRIPDPKFRTLVQCLREYRLKGTTHPLRTTIAIRLGPLIYKAAGVKKFSEYAALAVSEGIVLLGGPKAGGDWITLTDEWLGAP